MSTNRATIVPVRLSGEELKVIDALARQMGLGRSTCLRMAALELAKLKGIELPAMKER